MINSLNFWDMNLLNISLISSCYFCFNSLYKFSFYYFLFLYINRNLPVYLIRDLISLRDFLDFLVWVIIMGNLLLTVIVVLQIVRIWVNNYSFVFRSTSRCAFSTIITCTQSWWRNIVRKSLIWRGRNYLSQLILLFF